MSNDWTAPPEKRRSWVRRNPIVWGIVAALVLFGIGIAVGAAAQAGEVEDLKDEVAALEARAPETITKTVTSIVEGKAVEVEKTPQACLDALDSASRFAGYTITGFDAAANVISAQSEALTLAGELLDNPFAATAADTDRITTLTEQINAENVRLEQLVTDVEGETDVMAPAATRCRNAAR